MGGVKAKQGVKVKESDVVAGCLELLALKGIFAWRNNTGALKTAAGHYVRFGLKGSADILGLLYDGRFLAIECKGTGGRLSQAQDAFLHNIKADNGVAVVVWSVEELEKELEEAVL